MWYIVLFLLIPCTLHHICTCACICTCRSNIESVQWEIRHVCVHVDMCHFPHRSPSPSLGLHVQGVLLYGPPGTGKTLLARAVAHHTECCFIRVSGSELVQKYIGEGSRMVRELFVMAREHAPSIIFMDEIDSIGSSRLGGGSGGGCGLNWEVVWYHCTD